MTVQNDGPQQGYFERHEEQAFILRALLISSVIIVIRQLTSDIAAQAYLIITFASFFFLYILFRGLTGDEGMCHTLKQYISVTGILHSEEETTRHGRPVLTYLLIITNALIYYALAFNIKHPKFLLENFAFPPSKPELWNVALSPFTSMFLHAGDGHLWGNMIFLWAFGSIVEKRIGWKKFLLLYIATGITGSLTYAAVAYMAKGSVMPAVGASGAIAGIMGIFAVRCFFKDMMFPLPFIGILLPIKIKLNSLAVIGLFFSSDLSGGIGQLTGNSTSNVGHWAHMGGMMAGIAVAYYLGMNKKAIEERHLEIGVKKYDSGHGFGMGEQSLKKVLETDPYNVEALLCLARTKTKFGPSAEGKESYIKAIGLLMRTNPMDAVNAFKEFNESYGMVKPPLLFRLACACEQNHDLETAKRCFQSLSSAGEASPDIREKSMFKLAVILDDMGQSESAMNYYTNFLDAFPESVLVPKVKISLEKLKRA